MPSRADRRLRVGLDIGGTKTQAVLLDEAGAVLATARTPTVHGVAGVLDAAVTTVDRVLAVAGQVWPGSVGVGLPGVVDAEAGRVEHAVNLGIDEPVALAALLAERLGVPVRCENDLNAAAIGARQVLVAAGETDVDDLAFLALGTGLAAGLLLVVTVVADPGARSRGALGAAAVVLLASALVWAVVLFVGWGPQVAAAVTVGAVPLALRALPSTLLDVPDGYFIDYEASMGTRWSIRGRVPADPGPVDGAGIGGQVQAATAARTSGTLVLSVLGAVSLPFAVPAEPAGGLVLGGRIALLICYATAMTLLARSVGVRGLHWAPRGSAAVAVVVGARLALDALPATGAALAACAALLAGLVVAGLVVLVGRGARSLVLSRTADIAETLTIALSLPAGLLAGDLIDHLRALVAA
ncbi:ROK family protein [Cellulomonas citrea]|uniref:ROK family protein n=1 Tax=Cellulomonas citrea TaxID=1909423 RepID=UPI00135AB6B6|nr:ROK family protein [Cellulomonas citrea]